MYVLCFLNYYFKAVTTSRRNAATFAFLPGFTLGFLEGGP